MGKVGRPPRTQQNNQIPVIRRAGLYLGVAFELPGTILGGLLVGYLLDNYLGTSPWCLIVITAIAFAGAFIRLVQWVKFFQKKRDAGRVEKSNSAD